MILWIDLDRQTCGDFIYLKDLSAHLFGSAHRGGVSVCIQVRSAIRKGNYGYKIFQFF
jgi:hypothetical protein